MSRFKLTFLLSCRYRFPEDPFLVQYNAKSLNPNYDPQGAGNDRYQYHFLHPQTENEAPYHINPFLRGRTFFSKVEVAIDGVSIEGPQLEDLGCHYQALNRLFCGESLRRGKYSEYTQWFSKRTEVGYRKRVAGVAADQAQHIVAVQAQALHLTDLHKRLMRPLTFDDVVASKNKMMRCGFDG